MWTLMSSLSPTSGGALNELTLCLGVPRSLVANGQPQSLQLSLLVIISIVFFVMLVQIT